MKFRFIMQYIKRIVIIVLAASVLGLSLLALAWLIPASAIKNNAEYGIKILQSENGDDDWEFLLTHAYGSRIDSVDDAIMLKQAITYDSSKSCIQNAMYCAGKVRYWNGYMVLIRPLMLIFTYAQFRYFFMLAMGILSCFVVIRSKDSLGNGVAVAFALGLLLSNTYIVPWNNVTSFGTVIYLGSAVYILNNYKGGNNYADLFTEFAIFAVLNVYFDQVTVLPQSLGIPLLFVLFIDHIEYGVKSLKDSLKKIICASSGWLSALVMFWVMKWIMGTLITGENVFANAFGRVGEYVQTVNPDMAGKGSGRLYCIIKNLASLLPTHGEAVPAVVGLIAIVIVLMGVAFIKRHADFRKIKIFIPEIIVMFGLPLGLYMSATCMSINQCTIFANRYQILWLFGVPAIYFLLIERTPMGEQNHEK